MENESRSFKLDVWLFRLSAIVLATGLVFAAGLYSGATKNWIYKNVKKIQDNVQLVLSESDNLLSGEPTAFLHAANHEGNGVTVNNTEDDKLVLIGGFFDGNNEVRLLRRNGEIVARWPVKYSEQFPDPSFMLRPPETDWNVEIHGTLINPDGSIVYNYEYSGTVKLSRCGDVEWTLRHRTHHSVERAIGGGYWIPGRVHYTPDSTPEFPPFSTQPNDVPLLDDLILKVDENGQIVLSKSVTELLYDAGFESLMSATGYEITDRAFDRELVHVNKIGELTAEMADEFDSFETGDLVLSLRNYNLIFVIDPDTWAVKWHQVGPWLRQHDPEFTADGTITIFNNNSYANVLKPPHYRRSDDDDVRSNIIAVDPDTGVVEVVYGDADDQEMSSIIRGKHEQLENGGMLITEHERGRILEVDADGNLVWEFINRYDDTRVIELTEARLLSADYFDVEDWSCN